MSEEISKGGETMRRLIFVGALLLTLTITGTMFAFAMVSDTAKLSLVEEPEFVEVEPAGDLPEWTIWRGYTGKVEKGDLFVITPGENWTGDLVVVLTITNVADLTTVYRALLLRIEVWDNSNVLMGETEYLTLDNGKISIECQAGAAPYTVELIGGYYITHRGVRDTGLGSPVLLCQVLQK